MQAACCFALGSPLAVPLASAAYILCQDVLLEGRTLTAPHVIGGILFFGLVGPMLASLTLTWAGREAAAEAEAQEETRRRARQLETASQVSQRITAILDVDELLNQIAKLIRDSFGYYRAFLFWSDANCNEIVLRAGSGDAEPSLKASGLRLKIGEQGITGRAVATGQPMLCNDVGQDPYYYPHALLPEDPGRIGDPACVQQSRRRRARCAQQPMLCFPRRRCHRTQAPCRSSGNRT